MDPSDFLGEAKSPFHWFLLIAGSLLAWIGKHTFKRFEERMDSHSREIAELQKDRVSRRDLDELRESLTATVTNVGERLETSVEARHQQNREDAEQRRRESREDMAELRQLIHEKLR